MNFRKPPTKTGLDENIELQYDKLKTLQSESKEYAQVVKQIQKLHAMRQAEKPPVVDPNTLLMIGANITGIILIVGHERMHLVTSKALGFVRQLR
jgi:hypothetical protein